MLAALENGYQLHSGLFALIKATIEIKLSTAERNALPDEFVGLPHKRTYPLPDATHARNAKARASEEDMKGILLQAEKEQIDAKADRLLRVK